MHPAAEPKRDVRAGGNRSLSYEHELPAVSLVETPDGGASDLALARNELDDDSLRLLRRVEEPAVDAGRDHRVVARRRWAAASAVACEVASSASIPPSTGALRLARGIEEALGREERRHRQLPCRGGEIGQARHARLEPVDDVEPPLRQREREVRARPRSCHGAAARDGERRADGDEVAEPRRLERSTPVPEVAGAGRRRDDGHHMAELAKLGRDTGDVVVHVVRLRPRERRDETDSRLTSGESSPGAEARAFARSRRLDLNTVERLTRRHELHTVERRENADACGRGAGCRKALEDGHEQQPR